MQSLARYKGLKYDPAPSVPKYSSATIKHNAFINTIPSRSITFNASRDIKTPIVLTSPRKFNQTKFFSTQPNVVPPTSTVIAPPRGTEAVTEAVAQPVQAATEAVPQPVQVATEAVTEAVTKPVQVATEAAGSVVNQTTAVADTATSVATGGPSPGTFLDFVPKESINEAVAILEHAAAVQETGLFYAIRPTYWLEGLLDMFHTSLHMPWWVSLVALAAIVRSIGIPFAIRNLRNLPETQKRNKEMQAMQAEIRVAQQIGDTQRLQYLSTKIQSHLSHTLRTTAYAMIPIPAYILAFFTLRGMLSDPTRIPELIQGGASFFTDLTVADPYFRLPIISGIATVILLRYGADMPVAQRGLALALSGIMLAIGMYITRNFPVGLHLFWTATALFGALQGVLLKNVRPIRNLFNIPDVVSDIAPPPAAAPQLFNSKPKSFSEALSNAMKDIKPPTETPKPARQTASSTSKPSAASTTPTPAASTVPPKLFDKKPPRNVFKPK